MNVVRISEWMTVFPIHATAERRLGMLLNASQCTGQTPPWRVVQSKMATATMGEKPWSNWTFLLNKALTLQSCCLRLPVSSYWIMILLGALSDRPALNENCVRSGGQPASLQPLPEVGIVKKSTEEACGVSGGRRPKNQHAAGVQGKRQRAPATRFSIPQKRCNFEAATSFSSRKHIILWGGKINA